MNKKIAVVALALVLANLVKAQTNLLTINPGFEAGRKGWYFDTQKGTAEIVAEAAHEGQVGMRIVSKDGDGPKVIYTNPADQKLAFEKGKKYKLEAWVKPMGKTWGLALKVYASTGFKANEDIEVNIKGKSLKLNEWQLVAFDFEGKDYPSGKFAFSINLGEILVDDFKLTEVK